MKMTPRTRRKIGVYFILGFFLLSTLLMSAMYFVDMKMQSNKAEQATGELQVPVNQTGAVGTGS